MPKKPRREGEKTGFQSNAKAIEVLSGPISAKRVRCRCGCFHDTTKPQPYLPQGRVLCGCGYTVDSSGSSSYGRHDDVVVCDCNKPLLVTPGSSPCCATCGLSMFGSGRVLRQTVGSWVSADSITRCRCGRLLNTSLVYEIMHRPEGGSRYTYFLPAGSARCYCGLTVKAGGTSVWSEHGYDCCRAFLRRSKRE